MKLHSYIRTTYIFLFCCMTAFTFTLLPVLLDHGNIKWRKYERNSTMASVSPEQSEPSSRNWGTSDPSSSPSPWTCASPLSYNGGNSLLSTLWRFAEGAGRLLYRHHRRGLQRCVAWGPRPQGVPSFTGGVSGELVHREGLAIGLTLRSKGGGGSQVLVSR